MKMWFRVLGMVLLSSAFVSVMAVINYRQGPFVQAQPQVAGASITKQQVPTSNDPIILFINSLRPAQELQEDSRLGALAAARLSDMLSGHYYAHMSPSGVTFADGLEQFGLPKTTPSCENLLMTQHDTTETVVQEWLDSPAHKACMMDPAMNAVGHASAVFDSQTDQILHVTIYASL